MFLFTFSYHSTLGTRGFLFSRSAGCLADRSAEGRSHKRQSRDKEPLVFAPVLTATGHRALKIKASGTQGTITIV